MDKEFINPVTGKKTTQQEMNELQDKRIWDGGPPYGKRFPKGTKYPEGAWRQRVVMEYEPADWLDD